jgi:cadmium resistance protein CadD (predicted permease)
VVATVLLAVGLYATTNIDNLVVLTAFYSDRSYRPGQVTAGEYLGLAVIVAVSVAGAAAASNVPHRYIGLLGLVPLTLGAVKLVAVLRGGRPPDPDTTASTGRHRPFVVSAVTVGNGGDNIAVYIPVFATRSLSDAALIVVVFFVAAGVWCAAARAVAHAGWTRRVMHRFSHIAVPVVYVALGVSILVYSGTLGWLAGAR